MGWLSPWRETHVQPPPDVSVRIENLERNMLVMMDALTAVTEAYKSLVAALTLAMAQPKDGEKAN